MIKLVTVLIFFSSFQILAGTWMQRPSFGGVGRHRATGVAIFNKGYMGLGHVNGTGVDISYKDWWEYDPASASWTQKADFPVAIHGAIAFSVGKKGYVGGGSYLNGEFYCFDPQTNTWTPIAPCPLNPQDHQAFTIGGKGYVYMFSEIVEYDPLSDSWIQKADAPVSFSSWSSAFSVGSSGFVKSGSNFLEFKPAQNVWIPRAQFPGLMSNGSAAFTLEDKGYLTCGFSGGLSNVVNEVWSFNPANNTWTNEGEFPGTSRRFPVAFAIGNKGYFGTGTNGVNLNDFWEFDLRDLSTEELELNVVIYPNPAMDHVKVELDESHFLSLRDPELQLTDVFGRNVSRSLLVENNTRLELAELPKGVYFLRILSDGETRICRTIFINH